MPYGIHTVDYFLIPTECLINCGIYYKWCKRLETAESLSRDGLSNSYRVAWGTRRAFET